MQAFVVGLSGGSGSGKSTVAFSLQTELSDQVMIFHIDDYFRPEDEVPVFAGMANWDDPAALYDEKMVYDLSELKAGRSVVIDTKSPVFNPEFLKTGRRIPVRFNPKPIIIVEGFLALHFSALRQLMDLMIYLELPYELRKARRIHGKLHGFPVDYDEKVLKPMHEKYVEPSKHRANLILDVEKLTEEQLTAEIKKFILQTKTQ